jgi:glucuronate isomerase
VTFLGDDFLLQTETARYLYEKYAARQPILDYHNHLPPKDIAENRRFKDLFEIWLEGDHYKWRAMRANGVDERYCTGDATPVEKFNAWAATVPRCLRNPLYHWTHLELRRHFGIEALLDERTAASVWATANERLQSDELRAHGILTKFNVRALCTTDDPADDLEWHRKIQASSLATRVYPAFRPDRALDVHAPGDFNAWTDRLARTANTHIATLDDFLHALRKRHQAFHDMGGRLSDHGLNHCYADLCTERDAAAIFDNARAGRAATPQDYARFASFMMLFFGHLDAEKGWTKQLHLGALRDVSTRAMKSYGRNMGYDSIGDWPQAQALGAYLNRLDDENALPRVVLYNVNPSDNFVLATMAGNFQNGAIRSKIQFGSSWWFLDQKEGIEWQLNTLSNVGLLANFVGMLTDSRSFMSFPRHEYFRRVLCNLLGREMENGELPDNEALVGGLVEDVCYRNVERFLGLSVPQPAAT